MVSEGFDAGGRGSVDARDGEYGGHRLQHLKRACLLAGNRGRGGRRGGGWACLLAGNRGRGGRRGGGWAIGGTVIKQVGSRVRGQVYLRTFPFLNLRLRAEFFLSFFFLSFKRVGCGPWRLQLSVTCVHRAWRMACSAAGMTLKLLTEHGACEGGCTHGPGSSGGMASLHGLRIGDAYMHA